MMQHYLKTRRENPDCILLYRLGDFYEMFFDDAIEVSKELEMTLTGKDCGLDERAPMCGVPFHAADSYIARLIANGHKVAICEQVEDPKLAKGLVERKVIKIVTPGTDMGDKTLDADKNNYIMCICSGREAGSHPASMADKAAAPTDISIAVSDISTGEFIVTVVPGKQKLIDEISRFEPREIVIGDKDSILSDKEFEALYSEMSRRVGFVTSRLPDSAYSYDTCVGRLETQFSVTGVDGLGLSDIPGAVCAAGALLTYLIDTQMSAMEQINDLKLIYTSEYMIVDGATRRNLELVETMRDKQKRGSLLWVLDKTKTAMGARYLRSCIEMPLMDIDSINTRLDAIDALNVNVITRDEMREYLNSVYDLERLMTRISLKTATPRDLLAFKRSLEYLPYIRNNVGELSGQLFGDIYESMDTLQDLYELIDASISEDAPVTVREGGIIKSGFSETIDDYKDKKDNSKNLLADIEGREREKTGIKGLKIKYNRVFGYFFDVTNSYKSLVPDYFIRKQTLANSERYTTDELANLSDMILGAEEKLYGLEYDAFCEVRDRIGTEIVRVQRTAHQIAVMDMLASLSLVATRNNYVRPSLNRDGVIDIHGGRHPVIEQMGSDDFIPNDTYLNNQESRIMIITGPNMAGKSTYMRQTALICLMAQVGSFVPAESASISVSDRIFTRVGASDDLSQGQSTFMVEMSEVANILRNATQDSLIIMDEIGRGTSTFDGLSIAWAVVEYIADRDVVGAKTLFATHYHELTTLADKLSSVNNYSIAIKESGDEIIFLRKIVPGAADKSYGIEVACLAGVPTEVTDRAREIAAVLDKENLTGNVSEIEVRKKINTGKKAKSKDVPAQLSMFGSPVEMDIMAELRSMDINNMTPVKALLFLQELKDRLD